MKTAWRLLPFGTFNAAKAMALDEAVSESVGRGEQPPTIRFWRWQPSAVSIGCFQSMQQEVNLQACREAGVDVVRRCTGGGAVYHDFNGEVTYSVIAPQSMLPAGIHDSYREVCGWLIAGLGRLGLNAEFKPINDVILNGKKVSGNAQTRRNGVVWQHGTVLYSLDVRKMFSLLKVSREKISDKMIASVEERVTSISVQKPGITYDQLYSALLAGFTEGKDIVEGSWSESETRRADGLADSRYGSKEWNLQR